MRTALLTAVFLGTLAAGVQGQERPQLHVVLRGNETPEVDISLSGLLADDRYLEAMESGFPLYVEYRVELKIHFEYEGA